MGSVGGLFAAVAVNELELSHEPAMEVQRGDDLVVTCEFIGAPGDAQLKFR